MDIKVNGRTLSDRPLVLGVQGDNNVEELRFLVPRYTDAGVDLSLGIGYAVFRLHDGTDGHVSLSPEVLDTDESTVSLTLLVGSQMTEQKGSGKLCLKVAGLESAMWSSTICDMFVNGTIAMPSPQPVSLFRMRRSVEPRLAEDESEPPLTVTERTINIPAELQTIAVAQDENSEAVKIVVPRYFDGQDLSVHDFILHTEMGSNGTDDILFNNQNGQMKAVEDSTVTLTWVLRPPQTSYEGKLNIQLLVQGDEFKWHSLIGELTIAKHITGDPVVPATPSMYEQWLAEVKEQANYVRSQAANIQTVVDEMDAIKDAPAAAERAEAAAAEAEKSAAESKGFRTFFSAVAPDSNGNLDPSRPMTVGPAASVEIESAGDRIQSVTALGFTQQAGSGDPSPKNVRQLTCGGLKLVKVVFNGTENWSQNSSSTNTGYLYLRITAAANSSRYAISNILGFNYGYGGNGVFAADNYLYFGAAFGKQYTLDTWKAMLEARYAAGDPVIVWYQPASETDATGLYAPIIIQSGEYRATCLPLTAPLCEGDSVVSWVKSGCDKFETFDGSEDEGWQIEPHSDTGVSGSKIFYSNLSYHVTATITSAGVAFFGYLKNVSQVRVYDYIAGDNVASVVESGVAHIGRVYIRIAGISTVPALRAYLAQNPLPAWIKSTNYTPAADIPVSLETHQRAVLVLDGTESVSKDMVDDRARLVIKDVIQQPARGGADSGACSIATLQYNLHGRGFYFAVNGKSLYFGTQYASQFESADVFKAKLLELYEAGTPAQFVYPHTTPITYAHPAVVLEAATGDQLTYTVTGQSGGTVSVALKPFQDGGRAKTADNAANAQNTVNAQTANNSQQLGGLTLSALQNRLVPVGYIFSWAPTSGGPDLSTASKVAAYFGFGTWQAYGNGQVLVGLDAGQTEFAAVGKTGGEKTHKMTISEMPSHRHEVKWSNEGGVGSGNGVLVRDSSSGGSWPYSYWTGGDGGDQPHNNLQPYITVYRWQRVK